MIWTFISPARLNIDYNQSSSSFTVLNLKFSIVAVNTERKMSGTALITTSGGHLP